MQTSFKRYLWLISMRPSEKNCCCWLRPSSGERNQIKKKLISRTWCTEELEEFHGAHFSPSHRNLRELMAARCKNDELEKSFLALSSRQSRHSCTNETDEAINPSIRFLSTLSSRKIAWSRSFVSIKSFKSAHKSSSISQITKTGKSQFIHSEIPIKQFRCPLFLNLNRD